MLGWIGYKHSIEINNKNWGIDIMDNIYKVVVISRYGEFTKKFKTKKEMLEQYNLIKSEYETITCEIRCMKNNEILFIKKCNKDNSFETLYNTLLKTLISMNKLEIESRKKEMEYNKFKRNSIKEFYHKLEEYDFDDIDNMDISQFHELKNILTQRRLVKIEGRRSSAFHDTLVGIIELLKKYKDTSYKNENLPSKELYKLSFYKEPIDKKIGRGNILTMLSEHDEW